MYVIKRLEMSPRCLKGLVGESGAGESLQTLTFLDAAAAETRLTSLAQCANPNWILHSKNMDLECNNIHTCSPLTAQFNNLCCVFTRHWPTALRAEWGNLLVLLEVIKYLLRFARLHFSFALECVSSNLTLQANQLCYNLLFQQSPGKYFPAHLAHLCWELTDTLRGELIQRSQSVEATLAQLWCQHYCKAILDSVISQSTFITLQSFACLSWDVQIYPSKIISSLHETLPCCFSFPFPLWTFDLWWLSCDIN